MKLPADKPEEYLSIDIETTALTPEQGQIIEFAAVLDNFHGSVESKAVFRKLTLPDDGVIRGHAEALAMNAQIIAEIAEELTKQHHPEACYIGDLVHKSSVWCNVHDVPNRPTVGGKNFAGFDLRFLMAETPFALTIAPSHRVIDPGSM